MKYDSTYKEKNKKVDNIRANHLLHYITYRLQLRYNQYLKHTTKIYKTIFYIY